MTATLTSDNTLVVSKRTILKWYFKLFLVSVLMLNFSIEALDGRIFIAIIYFSSIVALWMKLRVDKIVIYLWIFITLINIFSNFYASQFLDIPMYKSWMIYWLFIPLVLQYILNSVNYFGIDYILSKIKKLFYLHIVISIFALSLMLLNDFSLKIVFTANVADMLINFMHAFNQNIGTLYEYGFSRGYLAYFSIGLYLLVYSILSKNEKIFFGIYLFFLTLFVGAKAPLLAFLAIVFFLLLNKILKSYLAKLIIVYSSIFFIILFTIIFIEELNIFFMADGRYLFPVFVYSDFWQYIFGAGFGNYSLFAFKDILNFTTEIYTPLLEHSRVNEAMNELAATYGYYYTGRNDILFPIAESDLLFFTVQLGSLFTLVLFCFIIKLSIKNINLYFKTKQFNYQKNFFLLFIFLLITSILQDYFNSGFALLFFGFLIVFNNLVKQQDKFKKENSNSRYRICRTFKWYSFGTTQ